MDIAGWKSTEEAANGRGRLAVRRPDNFADPTSRRLKETNNGTDGRRRLQMDRKAIDRWSGLRIDGGGLLAMETSGQKREGIIDTLVRSN